MNRVKESKTPLLLTDNTVLTKKKDTEQKKNTSAGLVIHRCGPRSAGRPEHTSGARA